MEWLYYFVAMLFSTILVISVGLVLVEGYVLKQVSQQFMERQYKFRLYAARGLFVLVLCSIFEQAIVWLDQFGADRIDFTALFLETLTGQIWIAIIILCSINLFVQKLSLPIRVVIGLLILGVESMDGHIASLPSYMIVIDFIHLACAALWIGGITVFVLHWKKSKDELLLSIKSFMNLIWITIILLTISGTVITIMIVPDSLYLLYSAWGMLLIIKVVLVLLALFFGYKVRQQVKQDKLPEARALKVEVIVLVLVLCLAGIITALSPEPKANTLNTHKMGDELHYTLELTPNRPGANTLYLKLWTLEDEGDIAHVELKLTDLEKGERTEKRFVLSEAELDEPYDFNGFVESRFMLGESLRLPYPSEWEADVKIVFENGTERQFEQRFEN